MSKVYDESMQFHSAMHVDIVHRSLRSCKSCRSCLYGKILLLKINNKQKIICKSCRSRRICPSCHKTCAKMIRLDMNQKEDIQAEQSKAASGAY